MLKLLLKIGIAFRDIYYACKEYSYEQVLKRLNEQIQFLSEQILNSSEVSTEDTKWLLSLIEERESLKSEYGL